MRALSMFLETFVLAVAGRGSDALACYSGAGATASVILADYVGSVEGGEIQVLEAYTAVMGRSDYIPSPISVFLPNVVAHGTQWISDGMVLTNRGGFAPGGCRLTLSEYMRVRWPDGACDGYVGVVLYSKALARGYKSEGAFVESLGPGVYMGSSSP